MDDLTKQQDVRPHPEISKAGEAELERQLDEAQRDGAVPSSGILKRHESYEAAIHHVVEPLPAQKQQVDELQKKKAKKTTEKKKLVPVWRLFRYAHFLDILMIIGGTFLAIAGGVALPGHMLMFGRVINQFVYYSLAANNFSAVRNITGESCTTTVVTNLLQNTTVMQVSNQTGCLAGNQGSRVFGDVLRYVCDPQETLRGEIQLYSLYYVGLATAVLIVIFLATVFWNVSAYRQTRRMRLAFYRAILRQEVGWFDVNEAGGLSTRLADDIEKIQAGIGDKVVVFLQYSSTFVAGFVIGFFINWKLTLVVATMLPIISFLAGVISKIIASFTVKEQGAYATAGSVAEEVLSSIRTVVAFGGEQNEVERYSHHLKHARNVGIKKGLLSSIAVGSIYFFIFGTYALGFWYGSTLIANCELAAGDVVTVFFSVIIGSFSLGSALPEIETFATALGSATVVFEVIDREPVIDATSSEGEIPDHLEGNIEFKDIVFRYPARPDVQVLHGIDLQVKKGQTVALVGPSGCGKSTIVQLIQRFYNPDAGLITIDGHDIRTLNLKWLRSNIGVVSQEPVLFNTTIAENIRYGKESVTMAEIEAAAKDANAHNFIKQLPEGYETFVGERGTQLSGGQKQRIAIARALVRDPKILLLDEATSALDTQSEKVVQDALDKAREGRTTIVIAHRLSTIQTADVIASIEGGRVVEMGPHSELMDNEGLYYELVTAQTIADEEQQQEVLEPLADFRAACKRSISFERQKSESVSKSVPSFRHQSSVSSRGTPAYLHQSSVTSRGTPAYLHQSSVTSRGTSSHLHQPPAEPDQSFFDGGIFSRFSLEDIPGAAHPSPFPSRRDLSRLDAHDDDVFEAEEDRFEKAVRFEEEEAEEEEEEEPSTKKRRSLLSRRQRKRKEKESLPPVSFLELLKLNIPDWYLVLIGTICSALFGCLFPLMSILFSEVLRIFGATDPDTIRNDSIGIAMGFLGLAVGAFLILFVSSFSLSMAGERLTMRLRHQSFQAILRQEIAWFDDRQNSTGALSTRLAVDASEVKGATGIRLGTILQTIFGFIAAVIIAFTASWELSLVLLLAFPVLATVAFLQMRLLRGKSEKNKRSMEASGKTAVESIDNIRTVASLGVETRFYEMYASQLKGPFQSNVKSVFVQAVVFAVAQSFIFYVYSAGYSFGAFLVIEERATYDLIFRVFGAVVFTALSLGRASSFAPDASKAQASASRILFLLRRKPVIDATSPNGQKLEKTTGAIAVENLQFNYPTRPEVQVMQGLSVAVKPGQTLALVGPSGCGKSTVVSLIERFYDPLGGMLTLDGVDLRDLNLRWLRSQIGIVSQEPVLFDTTIAENIRYGALFRNVSDDEVIEAAKAANIHEFIESLPQGYNTNVGAKGTQLSGGQKQRISIARALVRDPKVLLLDEATSALDTQSEKVVQDALDRAREGRTSVVIAHRLSTIYGSDCIAVIHNGQVIESGTHTQLMAQHGAYYLLNTISAHSDDDHDE